MKLAYFHVLSADNDDVALGEAKTMGYVPETCLLGGFIVWKSVDLRLDPCSMCNGPRERCKGRPRTDLTPGAMHNAIMGYASALRNR